MPQPLLALVADDVTEAHVRALTRLANAFRGDWTHGDLVVVDRLDTTSATRPEDLPVRTVGLLRPVSSEDETPATPRCEVSQFIDSLTAVSAQLGVTFEVELDGYHVGQIAHGRASRELLFGLLEVG